MVVVSWAQANEDIYLLRALYDISHDADNAFYIDVGANDPEVDSVTKLFYDRGWHGVNVEPSPKWYQRLVEQRPRDINIQAAVSDRPGQLDFYDHKSGGLGTLVETIALSHFANHQVSMEKLTVTAITLTKICEQHAPANIHFLKVDVEGAEAAVLRGMDFKRFRPWVMCIESHVPLQVNLQAHAEWDPLLIDSGYQFVFTDMINRYYIADEHSDRAVGFKVPIDTFIYARDLLRQSHLENGLNELGQTLPNVQPNHPAPAPEQDITNSFENRPDHDFITRPLRGVPVSLEHQLLAEGPPPPQDQIVLNKQVRALLRTLRPHEAVGYEKIRLGGPNDGGYICLDDFRGLDTALSFGIENNVSWDLDVAERGLIIHQFDHTVEDPLPEDRRMVFHKKMITESSSPNTESLKALIRKHDKNLIRPNIFLKIDIENYEWMVFDSTEVELLGRIAQITGEFHAFELLSYPVWRERTQRVLKRLTDQFALIHVHANNFAMSSNMANVIIPNVMKFTFVNRGMYSLEPSNEVFPGPLDAPCNPSVPDIFLGCFRF